MSYYNTTEYYSWRAMKKRCYYNKYKLFHRYGGRGIIVCDRWLNSFENFLEDMGNKPEGKYSLDRINNDGNYEPSNCRWATDSQQNRNRSCCFNLHAFGKTKTITEWAEIYKINVSTLRNRVVRDGYGIEEALLKKLNTRRSY